MALSFLTNLDEKEFKEFLKEALKEILSDNLSELKPQPAEILNVQQAADFLKLKITTLYEKTSRKLIPHFKKGNKLYFHRTELEEWIKQGKVKTYDEVEGEVLTYLLSGKP
ncbi:MAG: helix-turn-helix domain-containing protein [Bacteroidetes bacterium]|nr:helix-turn-helix domain-containing protein [Bacteroidota bacterium]